MAERERQALPGNSDFVSALPWSSFGRKNVGYLFAVAQGAEVRERHDYNA